VGAARVGVAHGLAVFPGASRVGAAITVLLWIGVRPARAVDLAFLLTASSLGVAGLERAPLGGVDAGTLVLGALVAFLGVVGAAGVLRSLVEGRRLAVLALWTIPLGLGMLAYAYALPRSL
jgi:undecaprenyl-diphosphatase